MKLTLETYRQGMKILTFHYLDWNFDFTNPDMVSAWYVTMAKLISEQDFINAVNCYTATKAKGPSSPVELQQTYIEKIPQLSPLEALDALKTTLTLFELDYDDRRVVEVLSSNSINKALYMTYCNISHLGEVSHKIYPNGELKKRLEDTYICTWFITEYKRIQQLVLREACVNQITALPSGTENIKIGGIKNGIDN